MATLEVTDLFLGRACVGRNLASLELQIIVSSILRRFDFVLEDPAAEVCGLFFLYLCYLELMVVAVTDEGGFLEETVEVQGGY